MVKSQIGKSLDGKPVGGGGVVPSGNDGGLSDENGHVDHRHGVAAGIPAGFTESPELTEGKTRQSRLLLDLPVDGPFDILAVFHESAGQGVPSLEGFTAPFDQQHRILIPLHPVNLVQQDHAVDRQSGIAVLLHLVPFGDGATGGRPRVCLIRHQVYPWLKEARASSQASNVSKTSFNWVTFRMLSILSLTWQIFNWPPFFLRV